MPETTTYRTNHMLTASQITLFTFMAALLAIFYDAVLGHGLTWENDPYWTYWVTKTFLIATVLGLGSALFGIGVVRGAIYTLVHTIILTIYYWSLSPVGLPSSPEWLDLQHTWITGVPIHFVVIYIGYLTALWIWRRRDMFAGKVRDSRANAIEALILGIVITVVAGGLDNIVLGQFTGFTWFLVRLLLTVPFIYGWRAIVGRDLYAALVGGLLLALIWTAYSQFLGPIGLPNTPLRILNPAPPPAEVRWLGYNELYLMSLPVYLVVMEAIMLIDTWMARRRQAK